MLVHEVFILQGFHLKTRNLQDCLKAFSGLIWVQTVCKDYQQMALVALVGKDFKTHNLFPTVQDIAVCSAICLYTLENYIANSMYLDQTAPLRKK